MRLERDLLGSREIPDEAYYGIHSLRALENFPVSGKPMHRELIKALVLVKKAATLANQEIGKLDSRKAKAIVHACDLIITGQLLDQFIVDAFQGGAGTSANMNTNEVTANLAIELLGGKKGDYSIVHPIDDVNLNQSTNDVYPTALRIAVINLLIPLSESLAKLQEALQQKEEEFAAVLKVGRTQLQDAVPITLGQEFGAYAQAIARDRWRIYKAEERLRQINIGGTAVGTGLNAERRYIFTVTEKLRQLSGLGLARTEYTIDVTQNADVFVEVSSLLKATAVNLIKISNDLRLLSSGPKAGFGEIHLQPLQAGSSIMPGKVNPVIPEMLTQVAYQIIGNDLAITMAAQGGQLELNAFLPLIAHNLLDSTEMLTKAIDIFAIKCILHVSADTERCRQLLEDSFSLLNAFIDYLGYDKVSEIAQEAQTQNKNPLDIIKAQGLIDLQLLDKIIDPYEMTKPGIPGKGR